MFLLCKRGRKSDRWFSCRMACVCWSGLLAVQTHYGCFLFSFCLFLPLVSLLLFPLIFVYVCVRASVLGCIHKQRPEPLAIQAFPKTANKRVWKRIGPAPKFSEPEMKKIKRHPTAEPPQSIQVPVSCSSLPFLCSCSRFNVLISFWHKKRKKKEGSRGARTSCRRVPDQYPAGCVYLCGESKFVPPKIK